MSILSIRDKNGKMQEVLMLRGPRGLTGETGSKGDNGLSAYQVWLNNGNSGTEEDFLASLKGPQGGLNEEAVVEIVKAETADKLDKSGYDPFAFLFVDADGNVIAKTEEDVQQFIFDTVRNDYSDVFIYKGVVPNREYLDNLEARNGDVYTTNGTREVYARFGWDWVPLSGVLSEYQIGDGLKLVDGVLSLDLETWQGGEY